VIDLVTIHPAWIYSDVDWYLVPTTEARLACLHYGIDPERVLEVGLPIRTEFARADLTRWEARYQLDLDPETFTVLMMGGGEGSGRLRDLATLLVESAPALQILVVTGRNALLRRRLEAVGEHPLVRVFGYVDDILPLMAACDLVVSKAGPCTIAEAVACQRPLLLTDHLPQEEGNVLWVCENGLGLAVADMDAIHRHILLLARRGNWDLQEAQHTADQMAWHGAAAQAAEWVRKCSG
jgi:1,2-diacylglycerol 3-beta-galactosyltransferase